MPTNKDAHFSFTLLSMKTFEEKMIREYVWVDGVEGRDEVHNQDHDERHWVIEVVQDEV